MLEGILKFHCRITAEMSEVANCSLNVFAFGCYSIKRALSGTLGRKSNHLSFWLFNLK